MTTISSENTTCVICYKTRSERYWPFCSGRCANIDLGRWLNDSYAIPIQRVTDEEDNLVGTVNNKLD